MASLELTFYNGGYQLAFIPLVHGKATGEYDDFLTKDGQVWGRPVGVTVADDGSKTIWHITYTGK